MSSKRTVTFGALCAACPRGDPAHHRQRWPVDDHPPARGPAARRPRPGPATYALIGEGRPHPAQVIERIISWTATCNGRRIKLRYIGTAKNDAWLHNRCAAINLRTLARRGLTRSGGAWVLA